MNAIISRNNDVKVRSCTMILIIQWNRINNPVVYYEIRIMKQSSNLDDDESKLIEHACVKNYTRVVRNHYENPAVLKYYQINYKRYRIVIIVYRRKKKEYSIIYLTQFPKLVAEIANDSRNRSSRTIIVVVVVVVAVASSLSTPYTRATFCLYEIIDLLVET